MTTTERERQEWLAERAMRLLCAAMDRQTDETARLINEIADEHDAQGVFGVCYALAETVRRLGFPSVDRGDGSLTGDIIGIEQLPGRDPGTEEPHSLWAARFVAAYINGDGPTCSALFFGSMDDQDAHTGGVVALIGMAASIARQAEAEKDAGRES